MKIYIFICLFWPALIFGQTDVIKSLNEEISSTPTDSIFTVIDLKINELKSNKNEDSTIVKVLNYKLKIADSLENRVMKLYTYEELEAYRNEFSVNQYFNIVRKKANFQNKLGYTDEAIATYFDLVSFSDSVQSDSLLAEVYRRIGIIYKNQNNISLSLKYLNLSLDIGYDRQDTIGILNTYMTIGNAYKRLDTEDESNIDSALYYYQVSLDLAESLGYKRGMAGNYNNIGNVKRMQKKFDEALEHFFLALEINLLDSNKAWISYNYNNIGSTYETMGNINGALIYLKKSYAIKEELNDEASLAPTLENISNCYAAIGNYKGAFENLSRAIKLQHKYENGNKQKLAQELEAQFQNERKAAQIKSLQAEQTVQALVINGQQKDLEHQTEVRAKEKNLIYALGFILLSLLITFFVFWRNNRQRKKYTEELKAKNTEIELVSDEINRAHTHLALKNQEITDSINYAKRIQAAILPSQKTLSSHLNDAFVLYLPKDIVAGDFYWTERVGDTVLFAVADCTGHGVPGAMVSVICHNALNATIKQMGLTDPGEILDETTKKVLKQFEKSEEAVNDGMDIALCSFNTVSRELKFSGANTPLWIVRNQEVIKYKATRQPVGNYRQLTKFESNIIPIQKGDTVYMSSDGFSDQFGGEKGKKFLYKRFRELLLSIASKPIEEQGAMLNKAFQEWKSQYEQVDDVCVLGARVD